MQNPNFVSYIHLFEDKSYYILHGNSMKHFHISRLPVVLCYTEF